MSSEKFENLNDDFRTVYEKIRLTVKDRIPRSSGGTTSLYLPVSSIDLFTSIFVMPPQEC